MEGAYKDAGTLETAPKPSPTLFAHNFASNIHIGGTCKRAVVGIGIVIISILFLATPF